METEGSVPIAFGPVPSRRLGRSLGIHNVPPKACSCSCVYCQVGRTPRTEIAPRDFGSAESVVRAVTRRALVYQGHTFYVRRLPRIEPDEGGSS